MSRIVVVFILVATCLASCAFSAKKKAEAISALEQSLRESSQKGVADTAKVKELLADYEYYYKHYPKDSMCPVYLMRSGDFYRAIGNMDKAIDAYHKVYTEYPAYPKANFGLFLEAFTYENEKHNLPKARELYTAYVQKYPDTKMVRDVKFLLDHLGMTPDQIKAELDSVRKATPEAAQ